MTRHLKLLLIILLMSSHAFSQDAPQYYKVELYFGLSEKGKPITPQKWQSFVDNYITPSFPDGLTILDAYGQWRNEKKQIIKEKSKVVVLICAINDQTVKSVDAIKKKYCELYHQESVLEVDTKTEKVAF